MPEGILCWRCGASLAELPVPLRREEVCPACDADVHVCKLCRFYNPTVSDGCDEPLAGGVTNKERANFCDYFEASAAAYGDTRSDAAVRARAELDALFGDGDADAAAADEDAQRAELARLFGLDKN
ncbi:MAG: hypothetical protein WD928_02280 [Gammaproteobacteria bacterium]